MVNTETFVRIQVELSAQKVALVAVSKLKSADDIMQLYNLGQRDFGENYVQELVEKQAQLPADIRWHFIGHLQSNKVKYIAPFVHLIQSVDSEKLLKEIDKQAEKFGRKINCLLQVHIADEETKFGFSEEELMQVDIGDYPHLDVCGLMGMATFTDNQEKAGTEFNKLYGFYKIFNDPPSNFNTLSMGMSDDYNLAIECGSNMVRIGSLLFGRR